jgi:beta-mannanase
VRSIFERQAADNVGWVWSPYVRDRNTDPFEPYYPGHDVVDWVALDGYNWGRRRWWDRWPSFDAIFASSYATLQTLAPDRPIMVAEIGASERGGDKAAWMRDALLQAVPERYPAISAVVWFNQNKPDHADWRVDSSAAALRAWREVVADPRYAMPGDELRAR